MYPNHKPYTRNPNQQSAAEPRAMYDRRAPDSGAEDGRHLPLGRPVWGVAGALNHTPSALNPELRNLKPET